MYIWYLCICVRFLCEESLLHLVTSLCQLSEEDMQVVPGKVHVHTHTHFVHIHFRILPHFNFCVLYEMTPILYFITCNMLLLSLFFLSGYLSVPYHIITGDMSV